MNNPNQVSNDELILAHTLQIEALVQLGVLKGIWTTDEVMEVLRKVQDDFVAKRSERREKN